MASEPTGPWLYTPVDSRTRLAPKRWMSDRQKAQFFPGHPNYKRTKKVTKVEVNYNDVRGFIKSMLERPGWDDGHVGPLFVRLAFQASSTYDGTKHGTDAQGGICGAGIRFEPESEDPANRGLNYALDMLRPVRNKWPDISNGDLWTLAAYAAIESMGGPEIEFVPGRLDFEGGHQTYMAKAGNISRCPHAEVGTKYGEDAKGRISGWQATAAHIREIFTGRMGFTDREIVALIGGGHTVGRCHTERSGYGGRFTKTPTQINNDYFKNLLNGNYKMVTKKSHGLCTGLRPAPDHRQYNSEGGRGKFMMLVSDMCLVWDKEFVKFVKKYSRAPKTFKKDFGRCFKRLTELGFTESLERPELEQARDSLMSPKAQCAWVRPEESGRAHMRR